jgi:HPr kinase/phosphorylase
MPDARIAIHGTTICCEGRAVLIRGPSGSGKSDLALRCIMTSLHDAGRPVAVRLVADDQTLIEARDGRLIASAPPAIASRIEVRGIGIVTAPAVAHSELRLVADVTPGQTIERLPDPPEQYELLGIRIPLLRLAAFEASSPCKLALALLRLP